MNTRLSITLAPGETRGLEFDFGPKLATGDTAATLDGVAVDTLRGPHVLTAENDSLTGNKVMTTLIVPPRSSGGSWRVTAVVDTTQGETLSISMEVIAN